MTAQQYRPLLKAMYLVGLLFVFGAVSEPFMQVWPLRLGQVAWRFGAAGLFSGATVGVVFSLAWLLAVALLLEHYRVAMGIAIASLVLSVILLLSAAVFALDFGQVRGSVAPTARAGLDVTVLRAFALILLSVPATLALGITGWKITRGVRRQAKAASAQKGGLVYRTQP